MTSSDMADDTNPAAAIVGLADKVADGLIDDQAVIERCAVLADELEHFDVGLLVTEVAWELKARDDLGRNAELAQRNLIPPVLTVDRHYPSQKYTSPEVGDRVIHNLAGSRVVAEVVGVPGATAGDYEITESGMTIAEARANCLPNVPVVEVRHVLEYGNELNETTHRVPLSRLEKMNDDDQETDKYRCGL